MRTKCKTAKITQNLSGLAGRLHALFVRTFDRPQLACHLTRHLDIVSDEKIIEENTVGHRPQFQTNAALHDNSITDNELYSENEHIRTMGAML